MTVDFVCSPSSLPPWRQPSSLSYTWQLSLVSLPVSRQSCRQNDLSSSNHASHLHKLSMSTSHLRANSFNMARRCWLCTSLPWSYFMSLSYLEHSIPAIMKDSIFLKCSVIRFHSKPSHKLLPPSSSHCPPFTYLILAFLRVSDWMSLSQKVSQTQLLAGSASQMLPQHLVLPSHKVFNPLH